jgi:hypothetical protein
MFRNLPHEYISVNNLHSIKQGSKLDKFVLFVLFIVHVNIYVFMRNRAATNKLVRFRVSEPLHEADFVHFQCTLYCLEAISDITRPASLLDCELT